MEKQERKAESVLDSTILVDGPDDEPEETTEDPAEQDAKPQGEERRVPLSRRAKARERDEAIAAKLDALTQAQEKRDAEYREYLEGIRRENAELRGQVTAYANRPAPREERAEALPDPEALEREADAALDRRDYPAWRRKNAEATEARLLQKYPHLRQQPQVQSATPQANPLLMATAAQFGDVMGNPAAFEIAQAHDRILARQGIPEGPERWTRAFTEGRKFINPNGKPNAPTFSPRNREVLSASPTSSNGEGRGGGEPGIVLTAEERATAKKYKISEQDYAKELAIINPSRVVK
jgi:hypothetical protein